MSPGEKGYTLYFSCTWVFALAKDVSYGFGFRLVRAEVSFEVHNKSVKQRSLGRLANAVVRDRFLRIVFPGKCCSKG